MAYGIAQELDQLKGLSIQELMQRQSVDPQLVYAIALQEKQKMEAAKERQAAMGMQPPEGTVVNQMEQNLAQRMAPGVQMQGQRSMRARQPQMAQGMPAPQPQQARGISAVPAPNMKSMGMAMGGIVGYAGPDGSVVGANSKGPIPKMSPEENAMMLKYLEGLKKFDYYDKNPDKVSPQGRQALELERLMFEEKYPNAFRQKVSDMMYGPSKGMAMGGDVKGYAGPDGSLVEGEDEFAIVAIGPNGEQYTADDVRFQVSQGAVVRGADAPEPSDRIDNVMRRERLAAEADKERKKQKEQKLRELERQRRIEEDGPRQNPVVGLLKSVGGGILDTTNSGINVVAEEIFPEAKSYVAKKYNEGLTALQKRAAEQEAQSVFNAEQAQADAIGVRPPTREQAFKELLQPLMDNKTSVDDTMTDITGAGSGQGQNVVQTQGGDNPPPPPPKDKGQGLSGLLKKARPFADKVAGVAEILGRGAGASKGYEFSQIAEEGRKIKEAEANRANRLEEQRMMLEGRKVELDARNAAAMNMSAAEYQAEMLTDENIMMSEEYRRIEAEKLGTAGEGFFASPFNVLTDEEEAKIALEMQQTIKDIRARKLKEFKSVLGQASGASEQAGVSTAPTNFADYNPTT